MNIRVPSGKYVLAVSGGVDSMVLLDILAKRVTGYRLRVTEKNNNNSNVQPLTSNLGLVVAHFNHGIRQDSAEDERLVQKRAEELSLPFEVGYGHLGTEASEEAARNARYAFLRRVQSKHRAKAIITAHHQDDWIETALLNVLRGTGRKGLSSLTNREDVLRPLLESAKKDIIAYAKQSHLQWREDSTNDNTDYLRNYLRHKILPSLSNEQRYSFLSNLEKVAKINLEIDYHIAKISQLILTNDRIDRQSYIKLPASVSSELLSYWLRRSNTGEFDKPTISRLDLAMKTARPGTLQPINGSDQLEFEVDSALLSNRVGKVADGLV